MIPKVNKLFVSESMEPGFRFSVISDIIRFLAMPCSEVGKTFHRKQCSKMLIWGKVRSVKRDLHVVHRF